MTASALQTVGLHGGCRRRSLFVKASNRGCPRVGQSSFNCLSFRPLRQPGFKISHNTSHGCVKSQTRRAGSFRACHALSFQTVTADNDSENGETAGPSTQSMDLVSQLQGRDELRQFLSVTKDSFQKGMSSLKERGLLQSTKDFLQETKDRTEKANLKMNFLQHEQLASSSRRALLWHSEPWFIWPLVIFVPLYLLVTVFFGSLVSRDLLPLWIIGPVITGVLIRITLGMVGFMDGTVKKVSPYSIAVAKTGVQLLRDAKDGTLPTKVTTYSKSRVEEVKKLAEVKKDDLKLYLRSGQAVADSKAYVKGESKKFLEWGTIKYEDFTDWIRPYWRSVSRFFQKIF